MANEPLFLYCLNIVIVVEFHFILLIVSFAYKLVTFSSSSHVKQGRVILINLT